MNADSATLAAASLWLVGVGGFLGSGHCIGMCGPLVAIAEGMRPGKWTPWSHLPLHAGRLTTYAVMGAVAGLLGAALRGGALAFGIRGVAYFLGGAAMVLFALVLFDWLPWRRALTVSQGAVSRFVRALTSRHPLSSFALGLQWGLIPCGLVWAFLPAAAATGSALQGAVVMIVFGAGTIPALLLAGGLAGFIGPRLRTHLPRLAASTVMLLGILLLLRGAADVGWINHLAIVDGVMLF
jgi:sulfite exporter TauE/SafE